MEYKDTEFLSIFSRFGGMRRVIDSIDFKLSLPFAVTFTLIAWCFCITQNIIRDMCPIFITVSATMIAIGIAGLAIIVSMSDPKFITFLKQAKIYENILFMFWFSTAISGLSIMINTIAFAMLYITSSISVLSVLLLASTFLMLYSTFSVFLLVGTTARYGLYRGAYIEKNSKPEEK